MRFYLSVSSINLGGKERETVMNRSKGREVRDGVLCARTQECLLHPPMMMEHEGDELGRGTGDE